MTNCRSNDLKRTQWLAGQWLHVVSHHFQSLFGGIGVDIVVVLCVFESNIGNSDA